MGVDFKNSETKDNLMRAFAGESQARNRYTFAAGQAKKDNLYVVSAVFKYTAEQEKEHAEIFLQSFEGTGGGNHTCRWRVSGGLFQRCGRTFAHGTAQ